MSTRAHGNKEHSTPGHRRQRLARARYWGDLLGRMLLVWLCLNILPFVFAGGQGAGLWLELAISAVVVVCSWVPSWPWRWARAAPFLSLLSFEFLLLHNRANLTVSLVVLVWLFVGGLLSLAALFWRAVRRGWPKARPQPAEGGIVPPGPESAPYPVLPRRPAPTLVAAAAEDPEED